MAQMFSSIGFIRTLCTNILQKVPKANQVKLQAFSGAGGEGGGF